MTLPFAQASFPQLYEQYLVPPLFRPFAEDLVQDAGIRPGDHVLDVACGTGIVARLARERAGDLGVVVAVDSNNQMLEVARSVASNIEWREGDATNLPIDDTEKFDVVTCQQGIQFFPDRPAAASEMHRVLKNGGRAAISAWRPDDEFPFLLELRRVAERYVGPIADRRHCLGDATDLENVLKRGGFTDVRSRKVSHSIHFDDGMVWVRLNAAALSGMGAKSKELGADERTQAVAQIEAESADVLRKFYKEGGVDFEIGTNLATGRR